MEAARTPSRALLGVALFLGLFSVSGSSQSSWTSIAPMPVPRYGHAAVELAGLIHVLGGSNASDCSALTSHDVYDPVANTWVARAAMTSNRSNLAAAVLNDGTRNRLYAVGGSTGCSTRTPSMEAYDPVTDTWTPMAPMPGGERSAMAAGVVNGIMYVAGGVDAGEALSRRFESYNPLTNTWTTLPQLPYTRYMMSAGVLNGRLYLVGGGSATAALVNVDVYDPATGTWSAAASLPVARFGAGSVVANGRLYVVGGSDPAGFVASGTVYDPAANAWSPLAVLPTARGYAPLAAANGRLMLFGGYDATSAGLTSSLALATDSIPPATTATPSVTPNGNGWNNSDVGITLSAADDAGGSGVQSLTYALTGAQTGGGTSASSAAFTITSEGTTTVTYHATDVAGNVEPAHTLVVRIDKTAPVLGALANIVTTATSSAGAVVTFAIPASDGLSGVASTSASPKQSGSTFAPGTTHESVTVLDFAGNSAAGGFDVIVNPGRPVVTLSGGTFNANGAPHPAVASVTDGTGNPVAGTVTIQYVPGGASAPVTAGQYTATASFTSGDPAFTSVIPWAAMAPDPHAKSEPAAAEINGLIYVFGFDQDPNGTQSSFVPRLSIYNPQTNQWSIGASPSQVRAFASVGVLGGKLYVAGGCIMSDCRIGTTTLVEIYDPATNSWSFGPSLQTARFSAAAGVIGGKFYVAGGTSACPPCAEVTTTEVYDPATHLWSFVAPIPQSRDLEIGAVVNGELYVIGGSKASVPSSRVDVYNPVTNAWSSKAPMPTARSGAAAGVINGRIYVAGGTGAALLNTTESYDPVSNTWSEQSSLPTARGYAAGAVANSKLYVFDGVTSVPLNVVEAYDPANDVTASITILPAALAPPTLAVAPLTAVKGTGSNFTFSGTGAPGATVSLYDGSSQFQGGILVDASGNWSNLTAVDNFLVGSHAMTATQSSGAQTSSASAAVSVHVRPPAPGINFLNNIVSPTSPASVTVTGFGFYGGGQTPPTGATVTIFEGQSVLGTALVPSSGPWSTVISLPYGSHALTASQTLAGETSDLSAPVNISIDQPLGPPTLAVSPTTAVKSTGANFTFSGTAAPGATVSLFDGTNQFQNGSPIDAAGNFSSIFPVDNFLVGSHAMTAKQSSGAQTSGPSAAVTVHVRPPVPSINFMNTVISATTPASVTVTGFGFYGGGQTPPTGATVTIFEGQTVLGTALVPSSGPWSTVISLPYGSHALTASQTLAGETSDLSAPSTVTVSQPIGPPTLSASPTTVVSGNSITLSGSGAAGASVSLFDGASNIGGGIPVNGTGNWSTTRNFVVGSHVLTATQSLSNQTSGASAPVTVHVRPQAPNISSPASVTSATSPAGVALNGSGFYGSSQAPPTGSTVTVFEGATVRGTAVVTSAGQWSTTVQLTYGSHTLRASQALAGETSDLSGSVTATVNPALVSISVQPSTASMNIGDSQPFQADGLFSDGTHKMLPTSGSGSTGGTGGVVPSNSAWQVNFTPSLNVSACAQVPGGFSSQAFAPGNTGTVSTTWGSGSIIQVNGTMTLQAVDLTLTCNPDNGSTPGALHATWTGTRFEGTVTFSGSTSSVVITGWSTKAPMPTPRFAFVAATVNGIVYAMGRDNPSLVSPVEAYNPATDTWTTIGQMPVSLSGPAAAALNNKIYVAGGNVSGGNATTGFYVYDPAANTWATLPSMPTGRSHLALAAAGGKLYAIGGDTAVVNGQNTGQVAVVESFDPATNQWTTRAPMLAPRNFHVAGALNNDSMIVVAGLSSNGTTSTELYDVATNTWTAGPAMLSSVSGMASAVVSNALFVFGGFGSNGPLNLAHMFRPAAGQQAAGWAALAGMPTARNSLAAASVGDVIYAIGGQVNNLGTSTLEAFSAAPPSNFSVTSGTGSGGSGGSGGATLPVVQWQSSNPSVATIDSSGFAHGSAAGNTTIIATANGISCATTSSCGTLTVIEPADITFTLAPGSAPFTSVRVAVSDPATGEPFGSFELPIGQAQSVDPSAYRLAFTAPAGYTVTPSQIDVTVQAGQHVTVPLLFAPVDTPAPTLTLLGASPMTVEAGSSFVDPGATASDASGGSLTAQIQITGTVNPSVVGAYTLTYSVSDGLHTTTATRTVNVVDTTRPMITAPANVTAEATGPSGATVNPGLATATDFIGPVTITRTPSGNLFALGTTTVTWRATDGAGNFSEAPQQVTVVDTTGPSVTVPANIVAEATSAGGAVVTFSVSATDLVDGSTSVTCAPASGSTFAFGTSTVQCTSHDTRLNPGTGSFTVTVNDTLPPVVSVLTPLAEDVVATAPATVTVDVQVVDAGGAAAVTINGVSATNVGTTAQGTRWRAAVPGPAVGTALTITATATDRGGRQGSVSIVVDNDGIEGAIDRGRTSNADMSGAYSSEFNDGTTAGTIQRLTNTTVVTAVRSGGAIRLTLAGAGSAQISVCTGNVKYVVLDSPGESADVSCAATGTVTVTGRGAGSVDLYKQTPDSITQALLRCQSFSMFLPLGVRHQMAAQCSTSPTPVSYYYAYRIPLTNGQTASTGSPVVASPDNTEPIHVLLLQIDDEGNQVEAGSFDLDPGESADVSVTPGANRQDQILFTALIGDVTVTIGGVTQTVSQGQQITVTTDLTPPAVTLTSASPATTSDSPILVSAVFSEPVAGFDASSLVVTNATVSAFAGSGAAYTFALTPIAPGPVTAAIPGELFTDLAGNVNLASAVFSRTFAVDTTKPVLTLPGSITVDATSVAGAIVSYSASAIDDVSGAVAVTCSAASGSTFPIGTTTVTCSAADAAGNVATGSFTVLVRGAAAQVSALIARVQSYHLAQGTENSLVVKLQGVPANAATACSQMGAFINETQAQSGKKLTGAQANQLIAAAQQIKAVLGCP